MKGIDEPLLTPEEEDMFFKTKGTYGKRSEITMGKFIEKFPMQNKVLTEDYEIWSYEIRNDGIFWLYIGSTFPE